MTDNENSPGVAAVLRELDAIQSAILRNREEVKRELIDQSRAVKRELTEHREVVKTEMRETHAETTEKLDDIVAEVRQTNGRVRRLEVIAAVGKAALALFVMLTPFITFYLSTR